MKSISLAKRTLAGSVAAVLVTCTSVWAQQPSPPERYPYESPMMGWGGGWYGMILGPLFMILVLAGSIVVAALLIRWIGGSWQGTQPPSHMPSGRTALDILKERYARGEIDKEEFDERRRVLGE